MNLQEANKRLLTGASLDSSSVGGPAATSTIRFDRVVGPLGGSVFSSTWAEEEGDELGSIGTVTLAEKCDEERVVNP